MKLPPLFSKKLAATTSTRRAAPEYVDEPNMKLSSAFIVVLVLHVVAIGGIYAFTSIKAHTPAETLVAPRKEAKIAPSAADQEESSVSKNAAPPQIKAPAKQAVRSVPAETHKIADAKNAASTPKDFGETYAVAKGDNPVNIAKKLHVNYDELLKLNKIDDPKKLQIGQKLRIPGKHKDGTTP